MSFRWDQLRSRRYNDIHRSVEYSNVAIPKHPDLIPLTGGTPPISLLPIERLHESVNRVWESLDPATLYYGESQGHEPLRHLAQQIMERRGASYDASNIMITNGSQQGLDVISKLLLDRGDTVIVEAPTYFGALQVFDVYGANYISVGMDEHGIIPEELERALVSTDRIKMIYTIPTFQNPMGVTLSPERRTQVIELAKKHNVAIVEDDPYGEFWFGEKDPGPLAAVDNNIVYLGTFSKTVAPNLRMGWMGLPEELVEKAENVKEGVDIHSDRVTQRALVELARDGWLDNHIEEARLFYAERCKTMLDGLTREMPESVTWNAPEGGFFIWCDMPDGIDSQELIPTAARAGVLYIPGSICFADKRVSSSFRLGFTTLSTERIDEGLHRLGTVLKSVLGN